MIGIFDFSDISKHIYIIKMIIVLVLSLISCSIQAENSEYPLLKIDLQTASKRDYHELSKQIMSHSFGQFVTLNLIECNQTKDCPNFKVYDPFGTLLEQYDGSSTLMRYMDIINKYINMNNYPIRHEEKLEKLKDEKAALKIYEQRRRLTEIQKSEDWQKPAQQLPKKEPVSHKHTNQVHSKGQSLHKAKNQLKTDSQGEHQESTNEDGQTGKATHQAQVKISSRFEAVENVLAWKIGFIIMTVSLLVGMKYLKQYEQRIDRVHQKVKDKSDHQIQFQDNETLNEL